MTDTLRSDKATGEEPNRRDNPRFAGAATRARAGGPPPGQTRLREGQNRRRKAYARIGWINLDSGEFSSVSWEFSLVSSWFPSGLAGSGGGRPEFSGEPGEPRCLGRERRAQGARRDRLEACPTLKLSARRGSELAMRVAVCGRAESGFPRASPTRRQCAAAWPGNGHRSLHLRAAR